MHKSCIASFFVKILFPCLGFAPRSQSLACCAYAQAGSICSLSGFAHFVRVIRPQIRYFLIPLFPLSERRLTHQFGTYTDAGLNAAKRQYAQNPCPIRLSAGGGGAKSAPLNTFRRTKSALTHRTTAKAQRLLFRHTATNIFANCQNRHLAVSQIKFNTS